MSFYQILKQASLNIFSNKLRSFLALLGVLIGTSSIVVLITISEITYIESLKSFKEIGENYVKMDYFDESSEAEPLVLDDLVSLKKLDVIEKFVPYTRSHNTFVHINRAKINVPLSGTTPEMKEMLNLEMQEGRFLNIIDANYNSIVIGSKVAQKIEKEIAGSILGTVLKLNNQYYKVVGVLKDKKRNRYLPFDINNIVFTHANALISNTKTSLTSMILKISDDPDAFEKVKKHIVILLQQNSSKYFSFFYSSEVKKNLEKMNTMFSGFLFAIGSIALIVGGIGVMNVMLVSVSERKKEIGLRMAIGANQMDILNLFIFESIILSFIGGLVGVIVGIFASYFIVTYFLKVAFMFLLFPCTLGFLFSTLTGLFFGIYPAYRASKLNPINCLRES